MGNGVLNRDQTTWGNTDARLTPKAFYEPTINRQIAIRELGRGEALNDSMDQLWGRGGLKREEGTGDAIFESKSLIRGQRMRGNSAENPKITGSVSGRIAKTLIYDKRRKPGTDLESAKQSNRSEISTNN